MCLYEEIYFLPTINFHISRAIHFNEGHRKKKKSIHHFYSVKRSLLFTYIFPACPFKMGVDDNVYTRSTSQIAIKDKRREESLPSDKQEKEREIES